MNKIKPFIAANLAAVLFFQTALASAAIENLKNPETPFSAPASLQVPPLADPATPSQWSLDLPPMLPKLGMETLSAPAFQREKAQSAPLLPLNPLISTPGEKSQTPISEKSLEAAKNLSIKENQSMQKESYEHSSIRWTRFWSGNKRKNQEAVTPQKPSFPAPFLKKAKIAASAIAATLWIPTPSLAANKAIHPAAGWALTKPYVIGAGLLFLIYGVHRALSWSISKLSTAFHWNPNTADTVRFAASASNWLLGLGLVLHFAGISNQVLFAAGGIALGLAINKTLSNLLRATLFVINRPFNLNEKIRIDDKIYKVADLQPKYVKLQFLQMAPDALIQGDPGPETVYFTYSQISNKAVELFRPYDLDDKISFKALLNLGVVPFWKALKELSYSSYLKAALWGLGLFLFGEALPILKAHKGYHFIGSILPFAQSLFALLVSSAISRSLQEFIPLIGKHAHWDEETTALFRLALQLAANIIGISLAIGALGLHLTSLAVGLGVGAAAFTLASNNILANIAQAVSLRWQSPFRVGDVIEIAGKTGEVANIGLFYVVLKTGENQHTLIPYYLLEYYELIIHSSPRASENPQR